MEAVQRSFEAGFGSVSSEGRVAAKDFEFKTTQLEARILSGRLGEEEGVMGGAFPKKRIFLEEGGSILFKHADTLMLEDSERWIRENEREKRHATPYSFHVRERLAYLVGSALGFKVRETVIREDKSGMVGVAQAWIRGAHVLKAMSKDRQAEAFKESRDRICMTALLDYILWNSDRNEGNIIFTDEPDASAFPIDHGFCFDTRDALKFFPAFIEERRFDGDLAIDEGVRSALKDIAADPDKVESIAEALRDVVKQEILRSHSQTIRLQEQVDGGDVFGGELAKERLAQTYEQIDRIEEVLSQHQIEGCLTRAVKVGTVFQLNDQMTRDELISLVGSERRSS